MFERAGRCLVAGLLGVACTTPSATQRVVAGRTLEGRYIAPEAYAAILRAELLVAQGETQKAYAAYQDASEVAGYSAAVWTRLGALGCQLKLPDYEDAFAKAQARDADYEPLWQARAECALSQGDAALALRAAERATAIEPNEPHNSDLAAQSLSRLKKTEAAARWQRAYELLALRDATRPMVLQDETAQAALNEALRAGDLPRARRYALGLRLDPSALALHALQLGHSQLALEQSQLVLGANPLDADARVVALCAADLLRDNTRFQALLVTPLKSAALRPAVVVELDKLLSRRTVAQPESEPAPSVAIPAPTP
jgi:tetratricopeptide (TPR) repeat protein